MTNFYRFKLGFDRTFWIGEVADKSQESVYQVAVDSQAAALSELKPGAVAQEVHAAYAEVIQSAGYDFPFRCGRGTGVFGLLRRGTGTDSILLRADMDGLLPLSTERGAGTRDRAQVEHFMRQSCNGVAATHNVEIELKTRTEFVETVNSAGPCSVAMKAAQGLEFKTNPDRQSMSFSEDFGEFAAVLSGCLTLMGNGTGGAWSASACDYDFNDNALVIGAPFWARLVAERQPKEIEAILPFKPEID